ncbi:uncharacterized protein LOC110181959 isoform X2 [Drosophila serrata]|uniref:uncharacterized protein LOC110181959 isoform X2 n=1 Tax=Drosophila serrata TaxID=7274 RepID=UPI000A1D2699|nr:uncharacterized protein LOC110181959 isoform X2 [Drosophila serrata]
MELDGDKEAPAEDEKMAKPPARIKMVKVPPIWEPNNRRTHAALVYVFFRGQTSGFLPPDTKPKQPHIGYFSNTDSDVIELINAQIRVPAEQLQSYMMLSLVYYEHSYVSSNLIVGKDEALKFFLEDYKQQEKEVVVEPEKKKEKGGKTVNIMFGSDVPKLMNLVTKELEKMLQPIEVEQQRFKMEAIDSAEGAEREIRHKKQVDYLTIVTDMGVTVFGPQVNRNMFKKLTVPAEAIKMQCKEHKVLRSPAISSRW